MDRRDKRWFIIALLSIVIYIAVVLALWIPGRAEEEEPKYVTMYVMCRPNSFVNVREFPKKNGTIVGRLECGDEVYTLREKRGQYMRIYGPAFDAGDEWVHAGYLADEIPEIWPEGKAYMVEAKGRVALRRYLRGQRRAWTRPGRKLTVFAMTGEWALTNRGYIKAEYLVAVPGEDGVEGQAVGDSHPRPTNIVGLPEQAGLGGPVVTVPSGPDAA